MFPQKGTIAIAALIWLLAFCLSIPDLILYHEVDPGNGMILCMQFDIVPETILRNMRVSEIIM